MTETIQTVETAVNEVAQSIIDDLDFGTDRETLIERMDEECDTLFGNLVKHGRIDQYDVDDLVSTAGDCAAIIKCAEQNAWVEDDNGLWDGLTYGVLASIAFFSLRNLIYKACEDLGVDSNEDNPLDSYKSDHACRKLSRERIVELLTSVDIDSQDDEDTETLREALCVNVVDGTIEFSEVV